MHSKNSGMKFIPKEYEAHPDDFHTYGMILASMTFKHFCGVKFIPLIIEYVRHTDRGMNFTPRYPRMQTVWSSNQIGV